MFFLLALTLSSCGGGGGGDSTPFYGGIWDFGGIKISDECNSPTPDLTGLVLTVNQDGERVVVNTGRVVLEGAVNEDDGFTVSAEQTTNGCNVGYAYVLKNASDGEADAVFGLAVACGYRSCVVVWGGAAIRRTTRASSSASGSRFDETIDTITNHCLAGMPQEAAPGPQEAPEARARAAALEASQSN